MAFHWMYKDGQLFDTEDDTRIEVSAVENIVRVRLYIGDEVLEEYRRETGSALLWAFGTLKSRA